MVRVIETAVSRECGRTEGGVLGMDTAANILQIYGADLKGAALALIAAALVSLIREQLPDEVLSQPWVSTAWYWFRIGGVVVLIIFVGCLLYRGNNFVLNGSFVDEVIAPVPQATDEYDQH